MWPSEILATSAGKKKDCLILPALKSNLGQKLNTKTKQIEASKAMVAAINPVVKRRVRD